MKLEEALQTEIAHWEDQRRAATATEQASVCEAVLGALQAVAEKAGQGAQSVSTMAKPEADRVDVSGTYGRGRVDPRG